MKKVLSIAIAAALVAPVAAMADATIYGKVRVAIDTISTDDGTNDDTISHINSHASRLGVKGSEDLGNGLKAVYKIEAQLDILGETNEFGTADALFTGRNVYAGLAGNFGTVLLGRHDTPMKISTGKLDYFADTIADYNGVRSADFADRRADGTLVYISPSFSGLTVAGAIIPGENSEADGLADAYSLAGMYSNAGLYLAAAYEAGDEAIDALGGPTPVTGDASDLAQWRVGGGYDFGQFKVAAVYENEEIDAVGGGTLSEIDRWNISGAAKLGMGEVKATYFTWENDTNSRENTGFTIGYDHNFSKRTQLYALYHDATIEQPNVADDEFSSFSVGVNHAF